MAVAGSGEDALRLGGLRLRRRLAEAWGPESLEHVRVARASGRVNLIGDHTDYEGGFVLPVAVDLAVWIGSFPTGGRRVELTSFAFGQTRAFELDTVEPPGRGGWIDYVAGVAWSLRTAGLELRGMRGAIDADLPLGAGLSSSAALEVAAALSMLADPGDQPSSAELAGLCRRAEDEYVGVPCGVMDQLASIAGRAGHGLLIDCRSLAVRPVRLPPAAALTVVESGVPRRLRDSAYAERRAQCREAARTLARRLDGVATLRDVTTEQLEDAGGSLSPVLRARAEHVVGENGRVLAAADALERGDLPAVGDLLLASHRSLRDRFEVSCPELDALVDIAGGVDGVFGARLTGAGFGGSIVVLSRPDSVESLARTIERDYPAATGRTPVVRPVTASHGAEALEIS